MPSPLRYFVSYAHADKAQAQALMQLLAPRLAISNHYQFSAWIDDDIPLGSRWTDEIATALKDCDFGLLLLSPAFFASDFIRRDELPTFIDQVRRPGQGNHTRLLKPVIPVQLKAIPLDGNADLAGLDQLQIFRDDAGRAFHGLRGHLKDRFADQLVSKTVHRLRTLFP